MSPPRILVLLAHPDLRHSRVNRRLAQTAHQLAAQGMALTVRDLYQRYPDFAIDVRAEQAAAAEADLIVWLHPIHWYAMPALMKLWVDEVLTLGWAYGGTGANPTALAGKDLWLVASTGAQQSSYRADGYNRQPFEAFLPPYTQTAALCGMRFLPPLVLHGARTTPESALEAHIAHFHDRLRGYPQWPDAARLAAVDMGPLPAGDRPDQSPD